MDEEPANRLDPRSRTLWRISGALTSIPPLAGGGAASWFLLEERGLVTWLAVLPAVAAGVLAIFAITVMPELRWRRWRYELREGEVDLKRGILWQRRTLVPLSRVQHVDTKSGPLQRRFGLATVEVYTAAGSEEIPELALPVALEVRDRISELSRSGERL